MLRRFKPLCGLCRMELSYNYPIFMSLRNGSARAKGGRNIQQYVAARGDLANQKGRGSALKPKYRISMPAFFEVMIERNFSSAHQLRGYKGKCENLHGHNYKVEIFARGPELNNIGLLIDFGDLKNAADEIVRYLDHRNLNELPPFDEELNPSAENLAKFFVDYLNSRIDDENVEVYKVRCYETPTSVATYQLS